MGDKGTGGAGTTGAPRDASATGAPRDAGTTGAPRDASTPERRPDPPLTRWRFLGAFALDCALFFWVLAIFAFAGLGPLGVAPAIVVATALTGRLAKIRHVPALLAIGTLSFVTMVAITYAVAIMVVLRAGGAPG